MSDNDNRKRRPSRWRVSINRQDSERYMTSQMSRIDWGTSARDLASSFRSITLGGGSFHEQQVPSGIRRFDSGDERDFVAAAAAAASKNNRRGSLGDKSNTSDPRAGLDGSVSDRYGPNSRFDATGMNLVTELADSDLSDADDLSDMEDPSAVGAARRKSNTKRAKGNGMCIRQTLVLMASIGIIIGGSFGIGFLVLQNRRTKTDDTLPQQQQRVDAPAEILRSNPSPNELELEQQLLEIAERVLSACSETKLIVNSNECQELCTGHDCCYKDEDSGEYCGNDATKKCPAYVACRALMDGVVVGMSHQKYKQYKWG